MKLLLTIESKRRYQLKMSGIIGELRSSNTGNNERITVEDHLRTVLITLNCSPHSNITEEGIRALQELRNLRPLDTGNNGRITEADHSWTVIRLVSASGTYSINEDLLDKEKQEQINYTVLDESKVDEKMICPISQQIMVCPMTTKCNHTFDKKMIEHWLQKHDTCPLCRSEILWPDLRENNDLVKEMAVLKFKISQHDVEKIITKCEKQKIDLPDKFKEDSTADFSLFRKIHM
jgi:hypothetical protein